MAGLCGLKKRSAKKTAPSTKSAVNPLPPCNIAVDREAAAMRRRCGEKRRHAVEPGEHAAQSGGDAERSGGEAAESGLSSRGALAHNSRAMAETLLNIELPGFTKLKSGKVREIFDL